MTLPVRLWLRRSTALLAFPAMLVVVAIVLFSRTGWAWERSQTVSWATSSTILLGPLAAGLVAFDLWRRQTQTMSALTATTRRGTQGLLANMIATWLLTVLAWLIGVVVALVIATRNGAVGPIPWWTLGQGLISLLACVCIGALVGTQFKNVAAAPLAVVICYSIPIAATWLGVQGVMLAGGATAPLIGITQTPTVAGVIVIVTALIAVLSVQIVSRRSAPTGTASTAFATGTALVLAASLGYLHTLSPMTTVMRPSDSAELCVGESPQVCGPGEGAGLYSLAAASLSSAGERLAQDGIDLPDRYDYPRGTIALPPAGVGMLSLNPTLIDQGKLSEWDVALSIATPTVCPAYYGEEPPLKLLDTQRDVATWVVDRLSGTGGSAPNEIEAAQAAYAALQDCDASTIPAWGYGQ